MRIFYTSIFLLFLVGLGIYGAGSSLPEKIMIVRGVTLPSDKVSIFNALSNYENYPKWHPKFRSVEVAKGANNSDKKWKMIMKKDDSFYITQTYALEHDILQWKIDGRDYSNETMWDIELQDKTPQPEITSDQPVNDEDKDAAQTLEVSEVRIMSETFVKITETTVTTNPFIRFYIQYFVSYDASVMKFLRAVTQHFGGSEADIKELML